jgi:hypothetical protein
MKSNTPRAHAEEYVPPPLFNANDSLCELLSIKSNIRP